MPRKKSVRKSAVDFKSDTDAIEAFVAATSGLSKEQVSWTHDYAIIRLYRQFEALMLDALVGAINNDTTTITDRTGITFPRHLTDEVCEYLIIGDGYFDFKRRDGLIKTLMDHVPSTHYLLATVKKARYKGDARATLRTAELCCTQQRDGEEESKGSDRAGANGRRRLLAQEAKPTPVHN